MPKSSRQKQKILYLAKFFLEETDEAHPASMSDILAYLSRAGIEAERKSIYADLEELSLFGLDIVTLRGRGGGYFLGEREFQLPEVRLLVDAVQSSRFLTRKKSEELIEALKQEVDDKGIHGLSASTILDDEQSAAFELMELLVMFPDVLPQVKRMWLCPDAVASMAYIC